MNTFAVIFGLLMLAGVIVWLVIEIRTDRKWRASIKPTVPEPLERMPPRIDL